jgi:hypothetical protein
MEKFIFKCQKHAYDEFTGDMIGVKSSITQEFSSEELDEVLEEFENFLRASGFKFDGRLEIVEEEMTLYDDEDDFSSNRVIGSMVDDLIKNPITMKQSTPQKESGFNEFKIEIDEKDMSLNLSSISIPVSHINFGVENFANDIEACPMCRLPLSVMELSKCWDHSCPIQKN